MKKIIITLCLLALAICDNAQAQVLTIKSGAIVSINHNTATPVLTVKGNMLQEGNLTLTGTVQNTGDITLFGTTNIPIGGATVGTDFDQILATNAISISNATLNVTFVNSYVPTIGASFTLIDGGSLSGAFTTVNLPALPSNMVWWQSYNGAAGTFILTVTTALPVELLSFEGKNTERGNLLTWTTANEVNNKGFDIERLNGSTWENIGFKTANNKASNYQFIDNNPLPTSYYRLRQIDNDGKETLSKTISIQSKGTKGKLAVYPNPVSNLLTVDVIARNEATEGSDFQILNLLGQQVFSGKTAAQVDVSALPQGSYVLKVGAEQVKFVKQ